MLEIKNLSFTYPRQTYKVIDDISLDVKAGNIYGLLGPNGAGKSTLLYLIAGLLTPKAGEILLNGINTRLRKQSTLSEIFIVPEEFNLPKIKLSEYIRIQMKYYPKFSLEQMDENLKAFEIDDDPNLGALSMGQKKKMYMCVALAANTSLLLMDEPTNGLDIPGKASFRSFLASNMSDDRAIIISTHQVRDVEQLIDHVLMMGKTRMLFDRSIIEILDKLKFVTTSDPELIGKSYIGLPDIQGTRIVLDNDDGIETKLDLELLFELAIKRINIINTIFP